MLVSATSSVTSTSVRPAAKTQKCWNGSTQAFLTLNTTSTLSERKNQK